MKILIVSSSNILIDHLLRLMKKNRFSSRACFDGQSGYIEALKGIYDAIVIDTKSSEMNGYDIVTSLRKKEKSTPILMISQNSDSQNEERCLDCGADYYSSISCDDDLLIARINAIARRADYPFHCSEIKSGDIVLNPESGTLCCISSGKSTRLTITEINVAELLIKANGNVVPKEIIFNKICDACNQTFYNSPEVYICHLRKKLLDISSKTIITTVKFLGYALETPGL